MAEEKKTAVNHDDDLFWVRESVPLNEKNTRFSRSEGNLVSLVLIHDDGTEESFERVFPVRAFPISNPDEYISIREPDKKDHGHGDEIGMLRNIGDCGPEAEALIREELDRRYFTPTLTKIYTVKEKYGYAYWEVDTSDGHVNFVMSDMYHNIRTMEDGRVYIFDIDGNCFTVEPEKLDKTSYNKLETYL